MRESGSLFGAVFVRHHQRLLLLLSLLAGTLVFMLAVSGGRSSLAVLLALPLEWMLALLVAMLALWSLNVVRLMLLLGNNRGELGWFAALRVYLAVEFISKITPAGSGAPAAAVAALAGHGIRPADSISLFVFSTVMDMAMLSVLLGGMISGGALKALGLSDELMPMLLVVILAVLLFVSWLAFRNLRRLIALSGRLAGRFGSPRLSRRVTRAGLSLRSALMRTGSLPRPVLLGALASTAVYWLLHLSILYLCVRALGGDIGIATAAATQLFAMGVGHVVATPGGAGGAEAAAAMVLVPELGLAAAGAVIVLWRCLMLYLFIFAGGLCFFRLAKTASRT